jgi:hypothetical protein
MPAINSVVLTDGTTPITLAPSGHSNGVTKYRTTNAATAVANSKLQFSSKLVNDVQRQYIRFENPVLAVDSVTSETYVRENMIIEVNVRCPGVITPEQRERGIKYAFNAIASDAFETELTTGEGQW